MIDKTEIKIDTTKVPEEQQFMIGLYGLQMIKRMLASPEANEAIELKKKEVK